MSKDLTKDISKSEIDIIESIPDMGQDFESVMDKDEERKSLNANNPRHQLYDIINQKLSRGKMSISIPKKWWE